MKMWTLLAGVLLIVFGIIRVGGGIMNQMSAKPKVTQMDMYVSIACLVVGVVLALISRGMKEKA
jgi:hypothetical protein